MGSFKWPIKSQRDWLVYTFCNVSHAARTLWTASMKQSFGTLIVELLWPRNTTARVQGILVKDSRRNGGCQLPRYQLMAWVKSHGRDCIIKGMPPVESSKQPWQLILVFCLKWRFHKSTWILFPRSVSTISRYISLSPYIRDQCGLWQGLITFDQYSFYYSTFP